MRKCLKCQKDISGKHESAKFCSTSCRVMWNRNPKNKKQKGLTQLQQMQVIYNQILEAVGSIGQSSGLPPPIAAVMPLKETVKKSSWDDLNSERPEKGYEYFERFILSGGCEEPEAHRNFIQEVKESNLSQRDKDKLIQASKVNQF